MNNPRINSIEIQGFRAFGQTSQKLDFSSSIAAVWAPNSQGKTSLAEAFEFILTGRIVRRELMASSQDEFADALRNAHMPATQPVYVEAEIFGADGAPHTVRRTLTADYGKRQDCQSTLEIDGSAATKEDLLALGIVLSQPPLEAPVLAQHTLGYLFSAGPQERAVYFKTLLEVTDLDDFRASVAALENEIKPQDDELLTKLSTASTVPDIAHFLTPLEAAVPSETVIQAAIQAAASALIKGANRPVPEDLDTQITTVQSILANRRAKAFPVQGFDKQPLGGWASPSEDQWSKIDAYVEERAKIEDETLRLTTLFKEALALPAVTAAQQAIDCPLCATEDALTPQRVNFIRQRVQETEAYQRAETEAKQALHQLEATTRSLINSIDSACPRFLRWKSHERRKLGFIVPRIRTFAGDDAPALVDPWIAAAKRLARLHATITSQAEAISSELAAYIQDINDLANKTSLQQGFQNLAEMHRPFSAAHQEYLSLEQALTGRLHAVIDIESQTTSWQEFIDLARDQAGLCASLVERAARQTVQNELTQALRQIDRAKEKVLDDKFKELSGSIQYWWDLLRPDEPTYFSALKPRPGARRTIDFKAGLSPHTDRTAAKVRDVIAIFSHSQLHCLGLALFLARSIHDRTGFVVLDDPILSSDEDYRAYFNTSVIEKLIDYPLQVIILTQDQKTWKDLEHRYLHKNIDMFQMALENPVDGPVVQHTSDDLAAMLTRVRSLSGGNHPELRKQAGEHLRNAAERFCKDLLVRDRWAQGDEVAALSDYDGKNLGQLSPEVEPLLSQDASHPGKLRTIGASLNPAKHDDAIPDRGTLRVALGDLERLKKDYL